LAAIIRGAVGGVDASGRAERHADGHRQPGHHVSKDGQVHCFAAEKGDKIWQAKLGEIMGIKLPQWGYACTPVFRATGCCSARGKWPRWTWTRQDGVDFDQCVYRRVHDAGGVSARGQKLCRRAGRQGLFCFVRR